MKRELHFEFKRPLSAPKSRFRSDVPRADLTLSGAILVITGAKWPNQNWCSLLWYSFYPLRQFWSLVLIQESPIFSQNCVPFYSPRWPHFQGKTSLLNTQCNRTIKLNSQDRHKNKKHTSFDKISRNKRARKS